MATALLYDERCLDHDNGSMILDERAKSWLEVPHAEGPERISRTLEVLERSGVITALERVAPRLAAVDELELVHTPAHIERIRAACASGRLGWVGPEARVGSRSWEPALLAAGAAIESASWVLSGPGRRAFALARPPGHHASTGQAMGFCIFNNAAVAARSAQRAHDVGRVAIVDWDVHHGNGTEAVFWEDPTVLFCSLHQDDLYPAGSGRVGDRGAGEGAGFTRNVPLPAGAGDDAYLLALEAVVLPALGAFEPELIIVSAGQDPAASDPLGRMSVTTEGFRRMTERLLSAADDLCGGRLLVVHEGGYSADHVPFCNLAIIEAMSGAPPRFARDPIELDVPAGAREVDRAAVAAAL